MRDCFGVEYAVVRMPGNGLCGYSSLAYALTGERRRYAEVIEDLCEAFFVNPQLFVQRTLFGEQRRNLTHYQNRLRQAVASVQRHSVPEELWMEDGHLVAFSLMYDVTVFVYNVACARWYVYGEVASKGYICLLASNGHFDILEGMPPCARPPVPQRAEYQGANRQAMTWHEVRVNTCLLYTSPSPRDS